jgi:hypothetical protein
MWEVAMRPFVVAMAGPAKPPANRADDKPNGTADGNKPRKVATWAAVIGPIASQILGAGVILYEVLSGVNSPASLGVGLTLAIGGKFADVLAELTKRE